MKLKLPKKLHFEAQHRMSQIGLCFPDSDAPDQCILSVNQPDFQICFQNATQSTLQYNPPNKEQGTDKKTKYIYKFQYVQKYL